MNEVKLNINIPASMFKDMFVLYYSRNFRYWVTHEKILAFVKANWLLLDRDLREFVITQAEYELSNHTGKNKSALAEFISWSSASRGSENALAYTTH